MNLNSHVIYLLTISNANNFMFNVQQTHCGLFNLQIYFQGDSWPLIGLCKYYMLYELAEYFRVFSEVFQEFFVLFKELAMLWN